MNTKQYLRVCAVLSIVILNGCASSPKFACGAPQGVGCVDMGTVHKMVVDESLPTLRETKFVGGESPPSLTRGSNGMEITTIARNGGSSLKTVVAGQPLYVPPEIIRGKLRAFTDEGGDLHGETYLFIKLHEGFWSVGKEAK